MNLLSAKRRKLIIVISVLIILVTLFFVMTFLFVIARDGRVSHVYKIDDKRQLIIDNWDCGATCDFHTKVFVETKTWYGKSEKTLFSCSGVLDVVLKDVSLNSAQIESMDRTLMSKDCPFNQGDTIYY